MFVPFTKESWFFPVIQSVHLIGLMLLVGTIAIVDLHVLGFAIRRPSISTDLKSWTWAGLITMGITGPLLFWSDWQRYVHNPAFLAKMVLLAIAVPTHFTVRRKPSQHTRLAAVLSLLLWISVVLAGRAIADLDIHIV
jgi:hypothetical protein